MCPTWTDLNGQDDIIWGSATNLGNGTWYYRVNRSDHRGEYPGYNTHIYLYDNAGNSVCAGAAATSANLDSLAPSAPTAINLSWSGWNQSSNVTISGISGSSDNSGGSGVSNYQYQLNNGTWTTFSGTTTLTLSSGNNSICARAVDYAGNISSSYSVSLGNDTTGPTAPTAISTSWTGWSNNTSVVIKNITGSTDSGSGVAYYQYQLNNGAWITLSGTPTLTLVEGTNTINARAVDKAGNVSATYSVLLGRDTTPPTVPQNLSVSSKSSNSVTLSWTASTDIYSTVTGYNIYRDGTLIGTSSTNSFSDNTVISNQQYSYTVSAFDTFNNTSVQSDALKIYANDLPEMTLSASNQWDNTNTVNVNVFAQLGVDTNSYKWASGTFNKDNFPADATQFSGNSFNVNANGVYSVYAKDLAGNITVSTVVVSYVYIAPSMGNFNKSFNDLSVQAPEYNVSFDRTYNSMNNSVGVFGRGWSFSFAATCKDYKYTYVDNNGVSQSASLANIKTVQLPDGSNYIFEYRNGVFVGSNTRETLVKNADNTFTFKSKARVKYVFSPNGNLVSITDANSNTITISVDTNGNPVLITDSVNRQYSIGYTNGLISSITDPMGRVIAYEYTNGQLTCLKDQSGAIINTYNSYGYPITVVILLQE